MDSFLPCHRDIPYPEPEALPGACREGRMLSAAYAGRDGELTAVCRYIYQAILLRETHPALSDRLSCIAVTEMEHFMLLGRAMLACGTEPRLFDASRERDLWWSGAYPSGPSDAEGMLLQDMAEERRTLRTYEQMGRAAPGLSAFLSRIAADEEMHLEILEEEYRRLVGK